MKILLCSVSILALLCGTTDGKTRRRPTRYRFVATAYATEGTTARGTEAHVGVVAADRGVLPLGTRIQMLGAGPYSGVYVVTDTGAKVAGNHVDVYLPSRAECKRFGRKRVWVRVLKWGDDQVAAQK